MKMIVNIIICILSIASYFGLRGILAGKLHKNWITLIWAALFTTINLFYSRLTLHFPILGNSFWIVCLIFSVIISTIYAYYFNYESYPSKEENLYYLLVKPLALELVCNGLLLPLLYIFPPLTAWISLSILVVNGASFIGASFQVLLSLADEQKIGGLIGQVGLHLFICLFHALIVILTGSIWITLVLRILYGGLFWKFRKN